MPERSTPLPAFALGFSTLPGLATFVLWGALLFLAPRFFSGFWPSSYEYWPQAIFLALLCCVCVLWALAPESQIRLAKSPVAICLLLFFACAAISVGGTVYLHDSLLELARVLGVVAVFFLTRSFLAQREFFDARARWILAAALAGGVLVSVPAILDFLKTHNPRQFASFYNPNLFANFCAMALPLAAAGVLLLRRTARGLAAMILGLVVFAIIALGLVFTSSKGGFLAALCGMLVFAIAVFCAKGERVRGVLRAHFAVVAIIAILVLGAFALAFWKMILPRLSGDIQNDYSTMFRVYTWAGTWRMALDRPFFGWGIGSFPSAYTQFAQTGYTRSAHQSWLQIAAECGFPAMLFLLAACSLAFARGWKNLRENHWPIAAGSLGALVAFCVHGLTDSGWNIVSIGVLLMAVLAFLETSGAPQSSDISRSENQTKSQISYLWLLATLPLALGSWVSQRAQTGEDLRTESRELMARGAIDSALQLARSAAQSDPLSARIRQHEFNLIQLSIGEYSKPPLDIGLQPTRALNYLNYAEYSVERKEPPREILALFDNAIKFDPNDPQIRMARGNWKLKNKDASGWKDIEYIAALKDKPYGKYPATPEMVDLNFARAYAMLAKRYIRNEDAAKNFIARGLEVIAEGRKFEPQRRALEQATQGSVDESREQTMNELETQFKELSQKLS